MFGKDKRLLSLSAMTVRRAGARLYRLHGVESRIIALADLIDLPKVDDALLPNGLTKEEEIGGINRLEKSLPFKPPAEQHDQAKKAITMLRGPADM